MEPILFFPGIHFILFFSFSRHLLRHSGTAAAHPRLWRTSIGNGPLVNPDVLITKEDFGNDRPTDRNPQLTKPKRKPKPKSKQRRCCSHSPSSSASRSRC